MINIKVDQEKEVYHVEIEGRLSNILGELGLIIHSIHVKICNNNFLQGMAFERVFRSPEFLDEVFNPKEYDSTIFEEGGVKE